MTSGTAPTPVEPRPPRGAPARDGRRSAAETAWLLAPPAALALVAAIVLLGAPLADVLFPPTSIRFWPTATPTLAVRPEPVEHARYLIALVGPFVLAGVVALLAAGRSPARSATDTSPLVRVSQALLAAFLLVALIAQRMLTYDASYSGRPFHVVYFTLPTLVLGVAFAALGVAALRREDVVARMLARTRETPRRRLVALALALAVAALWLLTAVNSEASIGNANLGVYGNVSYWLDETFAVLDHRAPLVNFHAQYSQLWPYLTAGPMALLGASFGVYVALMIAASAATVLAIYAILRRIVGSSLLALALWVPFLATSFFMELGPLANRYGPANLFSIFPMRYGGPYLLAWLTVRHLDRVRTRWRALLFVAAGLIAVNNPEFGAPAFAATLAALLWSGPRPTWRGIGLLLGDALLGLLGAVVLVALLTLAVAGSLPHFAMALTFSRLWGLGGVTMLPMPTLGFHLVLYLTFAGALLVATVRAVGRERDAPLTGMLAWAGTFGLAAGSYFAGRSHPEVLVDLFSAWALALALLLVVVVRALRANPTRRPGIAELAVLVACGIAACSLAQAPAPWSQLERLGKGPRTPVLRHLTTVRFVAAATRRGERVVLLTPLGHRVAYDLGIVNVAPYAAVLSMPAREQMVETIEALRSAHGRTLFVYLDQLLPVQLRAIRRAGFRIVRRSEQIAELREIG